MAIIISIAILFFVYAILPAIATLGLGIGVYKRRPIRHGLAFTFDDGPDPIYTPQLLDLLKKYNIKATFFTLGSKVEKYPNLIRRMHLEGHSIGVHNYVHKSNWFRSPWAIRRELNQSASLIEQITGVRPIFYRPPWGLLNLFDFGLRKHFQIILWSLMVGDWKSKGGSDRIKKNLLQNIKDGDIILLHDSGDTFGADIDAPSFTIEALEYVFQSVLQQGYQCMRVDEMLQQKAFLPVVSLQIQSSPKQDRLGS
ncbi:polysaccharide deacetylase family protein [Shimazuella sp. AN120528]|nr:polysaccharide deacetylase family protein [Shimazuella soli]